MEARVLDGKAASLLRAGCVAVLLCWGAMAAVVAGVVLLAEISKPSPRVVGFVAGAFALLVVSGVIVLLAARVKCPWCAGTVIQNSWTPPHKSAHRAPFVGYKVLVLDVLQQREFVCYHCGERVLC